MFGVKPSLALNTALHADAPDTALRVILEGFRAPPGLEQLGAMPGFARYLDDAQLADLAAYLQGPLRARPAAVERPCGARGASPATDLDRRRDGDQSLAH